MDRVRALHNDAQALVVSWTNNVDTQVEMLSIPTVTHNAIGLVVRRLTSLPVVG